MRISIPPDIQNKINQLFAETTERQEVYELLINLWNRTLNVGPDQLARSILIISEGNMSVIKKLLPKLNCDPRDIIMEAEAKLGNPRHYFTIPFEV